MTNIYVSGVISAPIQDVWGLVRGFNDMPRWHPLIAESRIEDGLPADQVGCVRNFNLADGSSIREKLLALSDYAFSFTYCILESAMPVEDYIAEVKLRPITDANGTFLEWTAQFRCSRQVEAEMIQRIAGDVFGDGIRALRTALDG